MFQVGTDWNPLQSKLKDIITKKEQIEETRQLLCKMHSLVHSQEVYNNQIPTYMDEIWNNVNDAAFRTMPTVKDVTIAWNIWHITRIEDLVSNYLIADLDQVLDDEWLNRLNTSVKDTGNAMSDPEIMDFSNNINKNALKEYRNAVGHRTKKIIEEINHADMKRKVSQEGLERIRESGGVTTHPDSIWLLDFWGKKNVAGLFQMPITRHQIVHLNDSRKLKLACEKIL